MVKRSVRKHHRGGDFSQTTTVPTESTSTMQIVEQKATGFIDTLKEYASNIKNKANEYMNKATTGGRGTKVPLGPLLLSKTKKLRKPTKKSKSMKKHHKRKSHHKRSHHKRK